METIYQAFFSNSPRMEKVKAVVGEIANVDIPVLIKGESGTGIELVAQFIHLKSNRRGKPLIKVNCAAIPTTLLESELFGFEKGAFTGANVKKPGKFELADGGTIVLNDIGEIDISIQAKLLQVLQDGGFSRLGGEGDIQVNTRVITTTKDDLEKSIGQGRFREDLFFRINVISIIVPPVRERKEQILPLTQYFFDLNRKRYGKSTPVISPKTLQFFQDYDWPGNVRELENMVKRIVLFGEEEVVKGPLVSLSNGRPAPPPLQLIRDDGSPEMKNFSFRRIGQEAAAAAEKEFIQKALQETHWNRKEAAKILQISYKALLYKVKKYRLDELKNLNKIREGLEWPTQPNHS